MCNYLFRFNICKGISFSTNGNNVCDIDNTIGIMVSSIVFFMVHFKFKTYANDDGGDVYPFGSIPKKSIWSSRKMGFGLFKKKSR